MIKKLAEQIGVKALRSIDPEQAHGLALKALQRGLAVSPGTITSPRLACTLAGLHLPNPVGLAAGFDKNAQALDGLAKAGFGFVEVGATTPRAQAGNPKPRLFRLTEDQAAINRFGFNNDGMEAMAAQLSKRPKSMVLGLNLGANKDSSDRAADFAKVLAHCGNHIDFATVNVSSPNTEKLRDLQGADALSALLAGVMEARAELDTPVPVFLKIAPDLDTDEIAQIAQVALKSGVQGIIATNTTLDRDGLNSAQKSQAGGLSGQPLFERSTRVLAQLSQHTNAALPLIGVGGVSSAEQAYAKICAGACAVQLYTGLVYGGLSVVETIVRGLDTLLEQNGHDNLHSAIGSGRDAWL